MSIKRVVLAVFISGLAACSTETPDHDMKAGASLSLAQGEVIGIPSPYDDAIPVYRGLPYAAAPIGDLRWQPPQAAVGWDGVRIADTFADSCFQLRHTPNFVWRREGFPVSEDCLYLNVWAPDNAEDLPVMVWFHGGAHTSGQGHSLIFDGTSLAQQGVVVVTVACGGCHRNSPIGAAA